MSNIMNNPFTKILDFLQKPSSPLWSTIYHSISFFLVHGQAFAISQAHFTRHSLTLNYLSFCPPSCNKPLCPKWAFMLPYFSTTPISMTFFSWCCGQAFCFACYTVKPLQVTEMLANKTWICVP
jgi:hypothetical protein